jgi:carbamoyltransferase
MLILGLGGLGYRDSSAALVRDGRVVAAAAEERFTRVKHQGGFPAKAVDACLRIAGASAADVDHVAIANNPWLALREKVLDWYGEQFFESPEFRAFHIFHDEIHSTLTYLKAVEDLRSGRQGRFHVVRHHLAHMASSFLASPYEDAAVLDVDGRGEFSTSAQGRGRGEKIEVFHIDHMPNSLGLLYAAVTDYLGFTGQDDEFRVMSISSQGEPVYQAQFREIVRLTNEGSFELNSAYFTYREGLAALSAKFTDVFGAGRRSGEPVLQRHRDIAASLQSAIEDAVLHAARHLAKKTGSSALCFAGGVALNWVVNGRLAAEGPFQHFHVNPLAGDEGTAVGAALQVYAEQARARPEPLGTVALGPAQTDAEIEDALRRTRQTYERVADPCAAAAERLARGEIVGWFEGRMEFGPRGLGHRAILADPANLETKARLLRDVKPREEHHPFGVSLVAERAGEVFEGHADSPYMLLWNRVRPERRRELAGVVTEDGIARWHGVAREREPAFHALLCAFGTRTGRLPALVNTSLNLARRPPAVTPREALEVFATTGMESLVLGPFVIAKTR